VAILFLLVAIGLVTIGGNIVFIGGYWFGDYWWQLVAIGLVVIVGYSIVGH